MPLFGPDFAPASSLLLNLVRLEPTIVRGEFTVSEWVGQPFVINVGTIVFKLFII